MRAVAVSLTLHAFSAYVTGEINNAAGHREQAEEYYAEAIRLARFLGATFVSGVASVGLVTVRAEARPGRAQALAVARQAIERNLLPRDGERQLP